MKDTGRRGIGGLVAVLMTALAVAFVVSALLSSPAKAQVAPSTTNYPIPPSSGTAPQVATTKKSALAFTGADIAGLMVVAAVVIGGGGLLVLVSRKRRAEA